LAATPQPRNEAPGRRLNHEILVYQPYVHPNEISIFDYFLAREILVYLCGHRAPVLAGCAVGAADAPPVAAFGRTFSDREVLGGLVAASAFVVFLTSVDPRGDADPARGRGC
jgi:hypothetical protein